MTFGSLFAGIGGFDLGLERAGMTCQWQVEIDPWCRAVLAKHWPTVQRYKDVRQVHGEYAHVADAVSAASDGWYLSEGEEGSGASRESAPSVSDGTVTIGQQRCDSCLPPVDLLCGGFPCQPHSLAGKRGGSADDRDLWGEFARVIREVRPRWVLAENVPGLLSSEAGRFFGRVLGDLAACGYDAEWDCLPAAAVGAPHRRDRVWIVAHTNQSGPQGRDRAVLPERAAQRPTGPSGASVADAPSGVRQWEPPRVFGHAPFSGEVGASHWESEPDVGRVAHGVPARVDRLRGLGNAIVPQVAEWLGRQVMAANV